MNLTKAIEVKIPIDITQMSANEQETFAQKAQCVWWTNTTYSAEGCTIKAGSINPNELTCLCTHLTSFAVNYLGDLPACGDYKQQSGIGEECDDGNTYDRDGCSSNCQIEPTYTCTGSEDGVSNCYLDYEQDARDETGTVATLSLSGFTSQLDFMANSEAFKTSVASSIGAGTAMNDIIIMTVAFGADREDYVTSRRSADWTPALPVRPFPEFDETSTDEEREYSLGERFKREQEPARVLAAERRRAGLPSLEGYGGPTDRRLLAETLLKVTFQVNTPEGALISSILQGLNSVGFLSALGSTMGAAIGRALTVAFVDTPYVNTVSGTPIPSDRPGSSFNQSAFGSLHPTP